MYKKLKFVSINPDYCNYLRKYDSKVCFNDHNKESRPFIGILFSMGELEYFVPLSSPKKKHDYIKNKLDCIKILDGKYGVININNMIPVSKNNYNELNISLIPDTNRRYLLIKQARWMSSHKYNIINNAKTLYNLYKCNLLPVGIQKRCCDFTLLEYWGRYYK